MSTSKQSQNVPAEGILNSAFNTAKQVAHTLGEKIGYFSTADEKEFTKFVDPLATPKDLLLMKSQLKHVQTRDNSKPMIDKDIHILQNHHKALFAEIKQRPNLKHVEITHDASSPFLFKEMHIKESPRKRIFVDIREHHYQLKPVSTNDRSRPFMPRDVHYKFNEKPAIGVLEAGKEKLSSAINTAKQVAWTLGEKTQQMTHTLEDKMGFKFTTDHKEEFVKFVDLLATPKDLQLVKSHLKHVQTRDTSKPVFDKNVHIKQNHHKALFAQIKQRHDLNHVETRDASSPILSKEWHMKECPQKKIFLDIIEHHYQLTPVQTNDKSAPFIPRDAHIQSVLPSTGVILEAGKEKIISTINTAKQVTSQAAHTLGEKTSQAAHTLGEKTTQAAHTIGEKTSQAAHQVTEKTTQAAHTISVKTTQAAHTLGEKTSQVAHTLGEKTSEAAHTLGEKTQQAAHTLGEKTQQAAQTLEAKIGMKLTPTEPRKEEFVKFVDPLASPRDLKDAKAHLKHTQIRDKSKPVIDSNVHIKENHHKELLVEIEQPHDLKHVTTTHDASKPFIDKSIHIHEAPQKKILADITQHHSLKHVRMNDKSAPFIPRDVNILVE